MFDENELKASALSLYEFSESPAVRYKILFHILGKSYDSSELSALRSDFLSSDIVNELYREQDKYGGWGRLFSKDYSAKDKFPTSGVAIDRCLYIGLTINDRDILFMAKEYLKEFLSGRSREKFKPTNERVIPWNRASVCRMIEAIEPQEELCDEDYGKWMYIAERAFEDGEYSYERDKAAQHEVFFTREDRLIPLQTELLLSRRENISGKLEEAMLRYCGGNAYKNGYIWFEQRPSKLPESFVFNKTRRLFASLNYINQFRGSAIYLKDSVEWLLANRRSDLLWDWGAQVKDPWGYFGYFAVGRGNAKTRVVDCTLEILSFLKKYLNNNK